VRYLKSAIFIREGNMRRFVILAIAVTGLLAFGAATASAAANFKSSSFSVNNQGQLVCSFDVSGLGNVSSTTGSCTATSTADYQCINNGGKNPAAGNKSTSTEPVGTNAPTIPVHNGRAQGSITVDPTGPGSFTCPSGQTLYLVNACYTDITLTIGGATTTEPGPVCNLGPIKVKQ
jgi:hypothetical protein